MAGPRYLRYIVFAVICLTLVFFISSSSTTPQFQNAGDTLRGKLMGHTSSSSGKFESNEAVDPSAYAAHGKPTVHSKPSASTKSPSYSRPTDLKHTDPEASLTSSTTLKTGSVLGETAPGTRMNATFVTLARNSDIWEIAESIRHLEDRFNRKFNYDWVFLNDQPFDDEFKKLTTALVSGTARYGLIPEEHWSFPDFIDQDKAADVRKEMAEKQIIYGDSISYRHMCRFESGFFFRQPLMLEYEWYWRVEPSIKLFCDINYDTFKFMADHGKKYSFVLSLYEYKETIETLWDSVKGFMKKYPQHVAKENSMSFVSEDDGDTYNKCHFWSNFEIGNLDWLRSDAYIDYFNHLDRDGGFFYERWGDAPVHSIGAALTLPKEEIHFFNDIGYYHVPFTHCPTGEQYRLDHKCTCKPEDNFDWNGYSCTNRFFELHDMDLPEGAHMSSRKLWRRIWLSSAFLLALVVAFVIAVKMLMRR